MPSEHIIQSPLTMENVQFAKVQKEDIKMFLSVAGLALALQFGPPAQSLNENVPLATRGPVSRSGKIAAVWPWLGRQRSGRNVLPQRLSSSSGSGGATIRVSSVSRLLCRTTASPLRRLLREACEAA